MPRTLRRTLTAGVALALVGVLTGCASDLAAEVPPVGHGPGPSRVVVIGDSITRGRGLRTWQAWPQLLAARERVGIADVACDGAGVLAEGGDACDSTYEGLVERAVVLRPTLVLLQASSNDLGQDDDELDGATAQLVAEVHRRMPSARVVGLSAIWDQSAPPAQLADISDALRQAIGEDGGTWVDIGQPLRGHPRWMQSDDVHPTARGQVAIAAAVASALVRAHVRW